MRECLISLAVPKCFLVLVAGLLSTGTATTSVASDLHGDTLAEGFRAPPQEARPGSGYSSYVRLASMSDQEAALHRLEWFQRIGIGEVYLTEMVPEPLFRVPLDPRKQGHSYGSPQWQEQFLNVVNRAKDLGMKTAIFSSPGWSVTGGPWVAPQQAMKKLVWSRTEVVGGNHFRGRLAAPPTATGPFQGFDTGSLNTGIYFNIPVETKLYRDVAVMAYPLAPRSQARFTVTSSAGPLDPGLLSADNPHHGISLQMSNGSAWVQFSYDQPYTLRSATLAMPEQKATRGGTLEARSDDGTFRPVASFDLIRRVQATVSFPPVTARVFRFTFLPHPSSRAPSQPSSTEFLRTSYASSIDAPQTILLTTLALHAHGRVHEFERKAGFFTEGADDYDALATPSAAADSAVPAATVIDLTARLAADGTLDWTPPAGRWAVLRLGYSLLGRSNLPAPPEATGLEVDKLNREHMRSYLNEYLDRHARFVSTAPKGELGLRTLFTESSETGPQNWTDDMLAQFQHRRGYDPRPYLPALTGVIVDSAMTSDKFLWDFRRTIADLVRDDYAELAEVARARGFEVYGEALEVSRRQLGDDLEMRRYADVPVGQLWAIYPPIDYLRESWGPSMVADVRGAASVGHLYGRARIGSESFTHLTPYAFSPRLLKPIADVQFALGTNWLFATGLNDPKDTWAEQARPWVDYLSRSSWLLQQGKFVADVAYFYGEEAPLLVLGQRIEDTPQRYGFDFVNADMILGLLEMRDGHLVTPSGMRYRALQLGGSSQRMTVPVLRRIRDFVQAGLLVVGDAPTDSPSLVDGDREFARLRAELWDEEGRGKPLGRGRVYASRENTVEAALAAEGLMPDITYTRPHADTELLFQHRRLPEGELYYLVNTRDRAESVEVSFRVTGKAPELWRAETIDREPVSFRTKEGQTIVPLQLRPHDAVFLLFRRSSNTAAVTVPDPVIKSLGQIDGPWEIDFAPGRGAPSSATSTRLESWTASKDPGIRYFSGSATYQHSLVAPASWFTPGARLLLDLGEVRELAAVTVNGTSLGTTWNAPYRFDVTSALRPGRNTLEVTVTNLWVNRLIGDKQPGVTPVARKAGVSEGIYGAYNPDAPLRPSGLLGPVTLFKRMP